jgi:ATP dependent DNA ligase domain
MIRTKRVSAITTAAFVIAPALTSTALWRRPSFGNAASGMHNDATVTGSTARTVAHPNPKKWGCQQRPLYAFDLIELDGTDLRREPIERRKRLLIRLLAKASVGLQVNDHIEEPGDIVFRHACKLGFEGIVSKRLGSPYVSGRSRHWVKSKNLTAPAVKREAEEDWGRGRQR